jgi:large subunit ribosomal protein L28
LAVTALHRVTFPGCLGVGSLGSFFVRLQTQEYPVASVCDVCGKGPGFGHNVSHSHRRTNRRWNPNIQSVRTPAGGGTTKKLQVCTSCIKAGKVVRA